MNKELRDTLCDLAVVWLVVLMPLSIMASCAKCCSAFYRQVIQPTHEHRYPIRVTPDMLRGTEDLDWSKHVAALRKAPSTPTTKTETV